MTLINKFERSIYLGWVNLLWRGQRAKEEQRRSLLKQVNIVQNICRRKRRSESRALKTEIKLLFFSFFKYLNEKYSLTNN